MLLAVDVGNTNVTFAVINEKGKILRKRKLPTCACLGRSLYKGKIIRHSRDLHTIIVVSVVPEALKNLKRYLKKRFKESRIITVGEDVKIPLRCRYNKSEIGQDRLITAFAAKSLYGLPVLIIDFGTAVTFDAVSEKGVYAGGLILPGIKMSLDSLSERTAMLPRAYLRNTNSFIGRNTRTSIRNGIIYGYSSICEGLIKLFKKKFDRKISVVATGGDAYLISRYSASVRNVEPDLSLKGLYLLSRVLKLYHAT
ncbi:MAG: type III pantothenate kinase [Candidatus Omnitrophica bacterium]|nr:type III pantothenate kinase [Candidatus Omnitrophota bacterium]